MGTITPLKDQIDARRDNVVELRRQPRWIERMQERGLPNKDQTSYILGSFTPAGKGGAA